MVDSSSVVVVDSTGAVWLASEGWPDSLAGDKRQDTLDGVQFQDSTGALGQFRKGDIVIDDGLLLGLLGTSQVFLSLELDHEKFGRQFASNLFGIFQGFELSPSGPSRYLLD